MMKNPCKMTSTWSKMMLDDDWWSWKSVWVIKNEFFVYFSCLEKYAKYEAWIWTLLIDLKSKWHIYSGHKWSVVVLKNAPEIALCAGEPALDDRRTTSAHAKIAQALDDQRSDRRTTSGTPLGDLRWWACAGVDQRTTSGTPLGVLRWWAALDNRRRWTSAQPTTLNPTSNHVRGTKVN